MYITNIHIKNIQCFEDVTITINKNGKPCLWNVILGDNSSGKSCLLRCLAIGLCDRGTATTLMRSLGVDFLREKDRTGSIELTLVDHKLSEKYTIRTEIAEEHGEEIIIKKDIDGKEEEYWKKLFICGYGVQRSGEADESYKEYRRLEAVLSLFAYDAHLQNIELILHRQPQDVQEHLFTVLRRILMLNENCHIKLTNKGIRFVIDGTEVDLDAIGDGYSGTMTWILDFVGWQIYAGRLVDAKNLYDLSGIVLLDELELTLHPRLQRYIAKKLREHFPKVQFVVTSHSPIIAAGAGDFDDAKLLALKLEGSKTNLIDRIPSLRGMSIDQVLSTVAFGLYTTVSLGSVEDINRFSELMCKKRNKKEEEEYQHLMNTLEEKFQTGKTDAERLIEKAVTKTLENMLSRKPSRELELLMKEKLNKLFNYEA